MGSDFDEAVDELYALPPAQFVAAREDRVKAARAADDRELAARIHALRRPTAGAWMVNLLARHRPEVLRQLVDLGSELRGAQQNLRGDDLRALTSQRQQVVSALVREARTLARESGEKPGDDAEYDVERTLLAALADPDVGEQVTRGALVRPLDYAGFGPVSPADVVERLRPVRPGDRPAKESRAPKGKDEVAAARRRRARADADEALRVAEEDRRRAVDHAERAADEMAQAEECRAEAAEAVDRLRRELAAAEGAVAAAAEAERDARKAAAKASAAAERAGARHDEARRRLADLPP